jgi:ribosome-associated toxin RatA of RatAB toxin-antitoxin module
MKLFRILSILSASAFYLFVRILSLLSASAFYPFCPSVRPYPRFIPTLSKSALISRLATQQSKIYRKQVKTRSYYRKESAAVWRHELNAKE